MMNKLILIFLFIFVSCGQKFNSNTFDEINAVEGGTSFINAYTLLNDKCMSCHTGYHNLYSTYTNQQNWIDAGLVIAGNFGGSKIIDELQNYNGSMPKERARLTDDELQTLRDWIENI